MNCLTELKVEIYEHAAWVTWFRNFLQIAKFEFRVEISTRAALVGRGLHAISKEDRTYHKEYEMSRKSET